MVSSGHFHQGFRGQPASTWIQKAFDLYRIIIFCILLKLFITASGL